MNHNRILNTLLYSSIMVFTVNILLKENAYSFLANYCSAYIFPFGLLFCFISSAKWHSPIVLSACSIIPLVALSLGTSIGINTIINDVANTLCLYVLYVVVYEISLRFINKKNSLVLVVLVMVFNLASNNYLIISNNKPLIMILEGIGLVTIYALNKYEK